MAEELEIPVADNETDQTNDPLGILTPKKQSDNSDPLGILKKKVDGNVLNNGTTPTSPSKSPSSPSIFQEGADNANNNIFKQIGKQVTPELQQRQNEILQRANQLNSQPKPEDQTPLQKFDNMAASILGFNRDLTGSINPKKVAEIDHDVNGHWGNIVQNVFAKIEKTGTDIASGILGLISDAEQAQSPVKLRGTPMEQLISGLNGNKQRLQQIIDKNQLPNTFLGNTVNSIASIAPDIIGATAAPEAKIAEGAGLLSKAGGLLFNKFTNYLIGKGVVTNYGEARQSGQEPGEAIIPAIKGGLEGAKQGIELALLGAGSGLATKGIMAQAEKLGLVGAKGVATRQLVNLSTDLVAYAGVQPTLSAAEEGRFPTMKEIADGAGIAAAFRIKGGAEELRSHSKLNKAIEETQNQRQGIAIANFVDADHDAIKTVYDQPETAQELNLQALEAAKKAKETTDLSKKQEYVAKAITLTKASNVKSVADMVLNNPQGLEDFKNSPDIPNPIKQQFLQKAQEVTDLLKPKAEDLQSTTVIKPEENIPAETTTIAPKEYKPETKKSGVSVILPKQTETVSRETVSARNIETTPDYRTANVGNHEGEDEFALKDGEIDKTKPTELKKQQTENIRKFNVPLDEGTDNPKGETMQDFVGRVINKYEKDKETQPDNTTIVTHSSVLKTIKTFEELKDTPLFKDADWNKLTSEQAKEFTDNYIKESTKNGDIETFDSKNGKIHIARHGQTEDNFTGKFRTNETNLTEKGKEQAKKVGSELKEKIGNEQPKIISSDLPRAIHTSNIALDEINKVQQPTEVKESTITETTKIEPTTTEKEITITEPQRKYQEIESIKSEKIRSREKSKFVDDHFESIVSQLMLKNKIKRIC